MAIDFPNSPALDDVYTVGSRTWTWTGTNWELKTGAFGAGTVGTTELADSSVTAAKLASGVAVSNIGYTPANVAGPTFTGTVVLPSTTSIGTVSSTEIGYVDGVTSAIQTQLDSKLTATTAVTSNRNVIINGGFDVWQRGTSFADSAFGLTVDRWEAGRGGFASGLTVSRQTGPTNFQYCARVQRANGNTSTQNIRFATTLETANSLSLAGKTVTLSFYARSGANFSTSNSQIEVYLRSGTTTDAGRIGAGDTFGTGAATPVSLTQPLTTSWQRFSVSGSVASTATQLALIVYASPTGTAGANDWYEIAGVQVEAGAVATPFEFEDFGTTLAKCQRYYFRFANGASETPWVLAYARSTTVLDAVLQFPVQMRIAPTAIEFSSIGALEPTILLNAVSALTFISPSPHTANLVATTTGLTQFRPYFISNNGTGYIAFTAEL